MTPATLKIAVIGTINRDTVYRRDGSVSHGYGGILYNLIPLAQLCDKFCSDVEIWPVAKIGSDHSEEITQRLRRLPNNRLDAVKIVDSPNNHCYLTYQDDCTKTEILRGWVGAVDRRQLCQIVDAHVILVNFVSGGDITTASLNWLRKHSTATIHLDFHSRTLGRRRDGSRFFRRPSDWRATIACADHLQMNEQEFVLLAGKPPTPLNSRAFIARNSLGRLRSLIVTLGEKGALLSIAAGKMLTHLRVEAPRLATVRDPTGCGDIFSAAFTAARVGGLSESEAVGYAVSLASRRAEAAKTIEKMDFCKLIDIKFTSRKA